MAAAAQSSTRRPAAHLPAVVEDALCDLDDDLRELMFLCSAARERLAALDADLPTACPHRDTRETIVRATSSARRRYRSIEARLHALRVEAKLAAPTESLVAQLSAQRAAIADRLRVEQALGAALLAAPDWQSPSFAHSLMPAAGRQLGRIHAHDNDYKRDRHLDAEGYERRYVESVIDGPVGLRALLTGCGMSAFATIVWWLVGEHKLTGPVIAGEGLYHESRLLLERILPGGVQFVDEADGESLCRAIDELRPSAVFLDSLSNTAWMPMPDLVRVIERVRGRNTYLIVDNTCLSVGCHPFALAAHSDSDSNGGGGGGGGGGGATVRLVVFESLLKYAQLGLDRVNAGVIVARPVDAEALDRYREHTGANIPDFAVHAVPSPHRDVLERRLARLQRNALYLAARLAESAPAGVTIVHPGLPGHPAAALVARPRFTGGCLSVILGGDEPRLDRQRRLVELAVAEASRRDIGLVAGSSFGFDTTRIYLTATRAEHSPPFVRIAAGTEHRLALELLAEALATAIERCA
jgi:cystathionine beta-lyase/cystathionine gamma-synthase